MKEKQRQEECIFYHHHQQHSIDFKNIYLYLACDIRPRIYPMNKFSFTIQDYFINFPNISLQCGYVINKNRVAENANDNLSQYIFFYILSYSIHIFYIKNLLFF